MSRFNHFSIEEISEPSVNLTPLIDVVFVVLIIFIVIAPLLELDQIILADSARGANKACLSMDNCSPVAIQVRPDNGIWLNEKKVSIQELEQQLKLSKQQFPTATPQLFHDRNAHFGTYQSIKNAAEMAGFKQMDIVLGIEQK